jgi:dipeptidase E
MRLFLSSYRFGNSPQRLTELVGTEARIAIIANASDALPPEDRQSRVEQDIADLANIGLNPTELDLRNYFGHPEKSESLKDVLRTFQAVWVRGGNSFVLRRAMRASGFDRIAAKLVKDDLIAWAGYSAGIAVMTPTLHGVELVDDPDLVPDGYEQEIVWDGLGLIHFAIVPHYRSNHPESAAVEEVVQYYIENHILFQALRDGEVIVINGSQQSIYP